jgi:hypothetical protein
VNAFDYLTVLISIVLGLAIANVLTRLTAVVTARERVDFYWPPVAWAIWLFFISVQHWWAEWGERHTAQWNFGTFWLELLIPVDLFVLTSLVLPEPENGKIDLGEWFLHNRSWFFAFLFLLPTLSIVGEIARSGRMASALNFGFLLLFAAITIAAYFVRSRRGQEWITAQTMALTVVYVVLLYLRMPT